MQMKSSQIFNSKKHTVTKNKNNIEILQTVASLMEEHLIKVSYSCKSPNKTLEHKKLKRKGLDKAVFEI